MKKVLQNIALVAGVTGAVVGAYGPNAKARNYGSNYPNYSEECMDGDMWVTAQCSFEESTEQYKNGSYKEEVMYEPGSMTLHSEEAREIAAEGDSDSWCKTRGMLYDFQARLGRATDITSSEYIRSLANVESEGHCVWAW